MQREHTTTGASRPLLLSPISLRSLKIRNRIVVSPMCQYASVEGGPTDWHLVQIGRFAMGGAGVVFGEETAIEARGRKTYQCAGIWGDNHVPAYRRITDFIRSCGASPAIQLGHAGRKGACHGPERDWAPLTEADAARGSAPWETLAPSALRSHPDALVPREMDWDDIREHLRRWREAAVRAVDAGFDILEIHGAHGYLIHQFLSPIANHRTDAYGGDRSGRMRLALEVAEVVRDVWPSEMPVFFRVSAVDGKGGQWSLDDSVVLAGELRLRGIDVVDCSSGGMPGSSDMPIVPRVPGYQVEFAERIRREAAVKTMAVGLITKAEQAELILQRGQADLVALARELLWNPHWPADAAKTLMADRSYDLFPPGIAHRLRRRDEVGALAINQGMPSLTAADAALIETT
ncbi:MAG: NADH:flavin oxidoreductase/NADH oxidase [Hyphomicrobiaceae bacterium]